MERKCAPASGAGRTLVWWGCPIFAFFGGILLPSGPSIRSPWFQGLSRWALLRRGIFLDLDQV